MNVNGSKRRSEESKMKKGMAAHAWPIVLLALPLSGRAQESPDSAAADASSPAEQTAPMQAEAPVETVAEAPAETPVMATIPVDPAVEVSPEPATKTESSNRLVEEIVVTAQKREERLQDVPISVQAFSQAKLDVLGLQFVQGIQRAACVPSSRSELGHFISPGECYD